VKSKTLIFLSYILFLGAPLFSSDTVIGEKKPFSDSTYSTAAAMTLDFLPGGGHFYTGHYISGSLFFASKIGMAGVSWLLYSYSESAGRNYRSAKKERDFFGVSDSTPIPGRNRSVSSYRRDYDRKIQFLTMSLAANAALWAASWLMVWNYCDDVNKTAIPSFDAGLSLGGAGSGREMQFRLCAGCSF
jgi:hypothetical protein